MDYLNIAQLSSDEAREYRMIKTNLCTVSGEDLPLKAILVAASVNGEGTTTVARNLASSFAEESGLRVLLIDMGLASNNVKEQPNGLTNYLSGNLPDLNSLILKTNIPDLFVLPPGNAPSRPSLFTDSSRFMEMIGQLKEFYSFIFIDAPPLQYYPESCYLASKVDGVILVIQAERTKREIVIDTKKKLDAMKANIVGAVMNRRKQYIPNFIYSQL